MFNVKQAILGTWLERIAFSTRENVNFLRTAIARPEDLGMVVNDWLAGSLTQRLPREGTTFLDIGAHLGSVMVEVARRDPTIKIVAFEPVPEKAAALRRKFPAATVHDCALGSSNGQVSFLVDKARPGYSSIGINTSEKKGVI